MFRRYQIGGGCLWVLAVLFSLARPGFAENEVIESRSWGQNYLDYADTYFADSTLKSTVPGCTGGAGSRYGWTNRCTVTLSPSQLTNAGGLYLLEVTHGAAPTVSATIMVRLSLSGGVWTNLTDQTSSSEIWTDAFQRPVANGWKRVGIFVLNPENTAPVITCTTTNTDLDQNTSRFYSDAYRFTALPDPCLNVPQLSTVNGPLYAGQTRVSVPNVIAEATKISVYSYYNGQYTLLGTKTSGLTAGLNVVELNQGVILQKHDVIVVTQSTNNVESCLSTTGQVVGGGPNPRLRVSISLWENTALSGPIAVSAGTPPSGSHLKFLGATNTFGGGFGAAPLGGKIVEPSSEWQTVSFCRDDPEQPDPVWGWAGDFGSTNLDGNFAALESIAFAMDDLSDTGPFVLYIDNVKNGTNLIQGFEGFRNGQWGVFLREPSYSSTTASFLLARAPGTTSPNLCIVTNGIIADQGTNCAAMSWQWVSPSPTYWLRAVVAGSGNPYPEVDLTQPISFRMLLLPLGVEPPLAYRPPDPYLQFSVLPAFGILLSWTNGVLQSAGAAAGPYQDVPEAMAPYRIPDMEPTQSVFFRLRGTAVPAP